MPNLLLFRLLVLASREAAIAASQLENTADELATQMQMSLTLQRQTPKSTVAICIANV